MCMKRPIKEELRDKGFNGNASVIAYVRTFIKIRKKGLHRAAMVERTMDCNKI